MSLSADTRRLFFPPHQKFTQGFSKARSHSTKSSGTSPRDKRKRGWVGPPLNPGRENRWESKRGAKRRAGRFWRFFRVSFSCQLVFFRSVRARAPSLGGQRWRGACFALGVVFACFLPQLSSSCGCVSVPLVLKSRGGSVFCFFGLPFCRNPREILATDVICISSVCVQCVVCAVSERERERGGRILRAECPPKPRTSDTKAGLARPRRQRHILAGPEHHLTFRRSSNSNLTARQVTGHQVAAWSGSSRRNATPSWGVTWV